MEEWQREQLQTAVNKLRRANQEYEAKTQQLRTNIEWLQEHLGEANIEVRILQHKLRMYSSINNDGVYEAYKQRIDLEEGRRRLLGMYPITSATDALLVTEYEKLKAKYDELEQKQKKLEAQIEWQKDRIQYLSNEQQTTGNTGKELDAAKREIANLQRQIAELTQQMIEMMTDAEDDDDEQDAAIQAERYQYMAQIQQLERQVEELKEGDVNFWRVRFIETKEALDREVGKNQNELDALRASADEWQTRCEEWLIATYAEEQTDALTVALYNRLDKLVKMVEQEACERSEEKYELTKRVGELENEIERLKAANTKQSLYVQSLHVKHGYEK